MQRSFAHSSRLVGLVILFLSVFAVSSEAQSRLNFPRVLSANELSTTGFALVNTSSATVIATFNFYDSDGKLVQQTPLSVPAKGQVAKLASEIFSTAKTSTWIQVSSASTELQGFELVGDFQNLVDGGGPAAESTQLAVIDFSKEDLITIVNPSSQSATVQLTLNGANGQTLTTKSFPLAAFQPMSFRLGDLNNDDNIDLVSISANVAVSAALITKLPGGADIGVTNATPVSTAPTTLLFPFAPTGPQGASNWKTLLGIANVGTTSQTVSITFNPDGDAPVTIQRNLAANATVGDTVDSLFSLSLNTFSAGWIRVTGTGPLAGAAAYQDSASGSLAVVPPQSAGSTRFFFGHIASLSPWYTGIALLNATTTAADVEVYAIDGNGKSVAAPASFSLPANTRRTALLSEFVPQVLQRSSDGGWVFLRTTNNVPLLGFELFGHSVFPVLANVQGFALPSASTFTPPLGPDSVLGLTVNQVTFTDGVSAKFQFKPSDLILYVATIVNSGTATGSAKVRFTVLDPGNQPMLSSDVSISLKAGTNNVAYPGLIPKNALTGTYTVIATLTYQGQVAANAGTFDVTDGASLRTVDQSVPSVFLTSDLTQLAFRPGDSVTVIIPIANFTGQSAPATINYRLTGPGNSSAGSGNLTFTAAPGISYQFVDTLQIPNSAP
jgi:hypothetical protein